MIYSLVKKEKRMKRLHCFKITGMLWHPACQSFNYRIYTYLYSRKVLIVHQIWTVPGCRNWKMSLKDLLCFFWRQWVFTDSRKYNSGGSMRTILDAKTLLQHNIRTQSSFMFHMWERDIMKIFLDIRLFVVIFKFAARKCLQHKTYQILK